jgi:geranylgeranyl diphosphate synthase, type II
MATEIRQAPDRPAEDIKRVPQDAAMRRAIRTVALELAAAIARERPPSREDLDQYGRLILDRLDLPQAFLGFAMVAVSNEFWRPTLEAVPFHRRLLLLPHCLSDRTACAGKYDSVGLNCAGCGSCSIHGLKSEAERLGYSVVVAEGTGSVLMKVLEGDADAIFGVACLDSLEKSFHRIVELGVPHVALPLLKDGCVDTEAEVDEVRALLVAETSLSRPPPRSYIPLLRETTRMFQQPMFSELLSPYGGPPGQVGPGAGQNEGLALVQDVAMDWLREGGKRLRPFVTIAAYAVARHGMGVLDCGDQTGEKVPLPVRRLALAIEALHKASLVHDDIEDDDEFRYGRPTVHRVHGVGQAVNIGDYLIGLGYRLIAGEVCSLGAECIGDILERLSHAHLELCRGQGAELSWRNRPQETHRPMDVLTIYALKTAPAFEVALYAGLRAAGVSTDDGALRRFSTWLGEGFQIRNDLDDWRQDNDNKRGRGLDALAGRPTILRAFAAENGCAPALAELAKGNGRVPPAQVLEQVRQLYDQAGAFARTEQLFGKLRARALDAAAEFPNDDLRELMRFLVRMVLPEPAESEVRAS